MGRDLRPEIPPSRRRLSAVDLSPPEAVAAERQRLEVERQRQQAARASREPEPLAVPTSIHADADPVDQEPEDEREELSAGEQQKVREAVRTLRGG
jgi:hypothetical protein